MADVTGRDRGQLIVVGGLVLAVVLVALALLLNSAIYTGNLATRETDYSTRTAVQYQSGVDAAVSRSMAYVNRQDGSDPWGNYSTEVDAINDRLRSESVDGVSVSVAVGSNESGTRFAQDTSGDFTDDDGATDWTLVDDLEGTGSFAMTVDRDSLFAADGEEMSTVTSEAFAVEITNSTDYTRHVYLYRSTTTDAAYLLTVGQGETAPSGSLYHVLSETCVAAGDTVRANLVEGTFGGTECPALSFYDADESYDVRYENAESDYHTTDDPTATGTYELVVDKDSAVDESPYYSDSDTGEPYVHEAIYESDLTMHYRSRDLDYSVDWTATPATDGPSDGPAPLLTEFDVTETTSGGDPSFDVSWTVTDANGDLDGVELYLVDVDDDVDDQRPEHNVTADVSGGTASNTVNLLDDEGTSETGDYRIRIEVRDARGQVVVREETVEVT